MASGEAPVPDGHTTDFYKTMKDILVPTEKVFTAIWQGGQYLPTGQESYIKVIPKKDKDLRQPGSCRPISLINVDANVFQIVARRLANILPCIIHPAQQGFVTLRSAVTNVQKVILVLERARTHTQKDIAIL